MTLHGDEVSEMGILIHDDQEIVVRCGFGKPWGPDGYGIKKDVLQRLLCGMNTAFKPRCCMDG